MRPAVFAALMLLLGFPGAAAAQAPVDAVKPEIPETAALRSLMIGRWYGQAPVKGGGKKMWLTERSVNGTFRVEFVVSTAGKTRRQTEVGLWGVSGPVYFTITRGFVQDEELTPGDMRDSSLYDAYEILESTPESFRYRSYETGSEYQIRKVGPEFVFPPPEA